MSYTLDNGYVLTDAEIERISKEYEEGTWEGTLTDIRIGRPKVFDEKLVTVPVKFPQSMVAKIDEMSENRSDFIRRAVAGAL
jgi:hypothetical protein